MKTLFVMDSISRANGGMMEAERRLQQTLEADQQVDVHVLGLRDAYSEEDLPAWNPLAAQVCEVSGPQAIGFSFDLLPAMLSRKSDLAYFAGLWKYPSMAGLSWVGKTRKPYLVAPHGMLDPWAVRNSGWKKKLAGSLFQNRHLRGAACLRALCISEAQSIRDYGLTNPICIVPNGIDLATPASPQEPEGVKTILFLGRLHPKKGLPALVEAWSKAHVEGWRLAIAGWDQIGHEAELRQQASNFPEGQIVFMGPCFGADKEAAYRECAGFILPSLSEGLPMTVLEAWSYGKPVLMTPECNLPEGFAAGAALSMTPDAESIAHTLKQFMAMAPAERVAIGAKGRQLVEAKFSWGQIAASMAEVYRWITGGGPKPGCLYEPKAV